MAWSLYIRLRDRPTSSRVSLIVLGMVLILSVGLIAVGCAPPAQAPASQTPPAPTVAPSPTLEAKAVAVAASPTPSPSAAPIPTLASSPTTAPSPTPSAPNTTATPSPLPTATPMKSADYPRVDGSTSTQPLQILAACMRLGMPCTWTQEVTANMTERKVQPGPSSVKMPPLQHTGTNQSYMALIANKTDLILVARQPSEDELAAAKKAGVELDIRPFALDAFVILLNTANPIESLSVEQIRSIYTGKVTNWTRLGGTSVHDEGVIRAVRRPRNSGSQELMESLVMRGAKMVEAPDLLQNGMEGMIVAVGADQASIGYIVYYYAQYMLNNGGVKIIGVDGVKPTAETIGSQRYPLVAEVYAVTRVGTPASHPATIMRDWWLSPAGQRVVADSGYVPLAKGR